MISLRVDAKDRVWGSLADEKIFKSLSKYGTEEMKNKDVIGTAYRLKLTGTYVLTEDFYLGFIHPSERYNEPRLGEQVKGRVIGVRPDGVLNLSLKPRAYEAISDDAQMILTILERSADQQINFTDKSDPEDIMKAFGITGRNLIDSETAMIRKWTKEYAFDLSLIQEACARTISSTGQSSFSYADSILTSWYNDKVHSLEDVKRLDATHQQKKKERAAAKANAAASPKKNNFNNFESRENDYKSLEAMLLNSPIRS